MILKFAYDKNINDAHEIGGKAFNLKWLTECGYQIPTWCVIPADYFNFPRWALLAIEIEQWMQKNSIQSIAVRSSAQGEDGDENSFAGQLNSYLNLETMDSIKARIEDCHNSLLSYRHESYLKAKNLNAKTFKMSVILQEMIIGEKSGVIFTANPQNTSRSEYLISTSLGLCEGVVSGKSDCDEWIINATSGDILKSKTHKASPVLDESEIKKLCSLGREITQKKGRPQDIEWTLKEGVVYLLQARDVTALPVEVPLAGRPCVFDNSNIQESFCGLTLPLTFSFARKAYQQVYTQLMSVMGFSQEKIATEDERHKKMLGLIRGRVFYNIDNWYKGLLLMPSFNRNKEDMEQMMGLEDPIDFVVDFKPSVWEKIKIFPQMALLVVRMSYAFFQIENLFLAFRKEFYSSLRELQSNHLFGQTAEEIQETIKKAESKFLKSWSAPIINDFYVMFSSGKVRRKLKKLNQLELYSDLLSGENLESINPTKELVRISDYIKSNPLVCSAFLARNNQIEINHLKNIDPKLFTMVKKYIDKYAHRVPGELKLESLSLQENAKPILSILASYCQDPDLSLNNWEKREKQRRHDAEKCLRQRMNFIEWCFFQKQINRLRQGVRFREAMRLDRTNSFGFFRQSYRAMGYALVNRHCLENVEDIFYLTIEEIEDFLCGQSFFDRPQDLVHLRKEQYKVWQDEEVPHRIRDYAPFPLIQNTICETIPSLEGNLLKGTGCFPGIVEGEVVVVTDPRNIHTLKDKILCSMRTDPGWTPLFAQIKGLLVERGSTLSHSAIIARELGIPTIIGIPGLTKTLKTGERVVFDSSSGIIKKEVHHVKNVASV